MGSISRAVKKIARPKVLLPLAALAIGGPMAAKALAAKGGIGAALTGTAAKGALGASAAAAPGSLMGSAMVAPSLAAGSAAAVPATAGLFGTAGAFAPLKGTLAKGIMAGLKNPFSAKGLMTYGGLGAGAAGLAGLMGKPKTEAQKNLGVDAQAQYDMARMYNQMMGGALTDEQFNAAVAPMLSQYGGEYETITGPKRKRRPMFPGLNYSGLTRDYADGGTIVGDDELSQRLYGEMMGAQMSDNTPDIETLQGIKDYIDYLGEMDQAEKALREEVPNPTGRAMGGRIEMGLGGIIGRAIREAMEAAMKNPNLGKVFGRSGGDLDVGDVEKIIKAPPNVAPRDRRLSNIGVFGRRTPRDIDILQDEVIDQMMEMDSIEGFADGGAITGMTDMINQSIDQMQEGLTQQVQSGFTTQEAIVPKDTQGNLGQVPPFAAGPDIRSTLTNPGIRPTLTNPSLSGPTNAALPSNIGPMRTNAQRTLPGRSISNIGQLSSLLGYGARGFRPMGGMTQAGYADGGSIPQTKDIPAGMQLDGRGGGFIPMGARERKDDVPAMLAKNEFVMTADAVRAAGGGDVNKGAQRMYDLMNSLESKV